MLTLLDGPMGTALLERGVSLPAPAWSAAALQTAPDAVEAVHRAYRKAGASVHTTNTFRTRHASVGGAWADLARRAVALCRAGAGPAGRVAGALAPLADCYRPDLSPKDPGPRHRALAAVLAEAGCDLLLVETFPHLGEAIAATRVASETGLPVWVSLTAGPTGSLLQPDAVEHGARMLADAGASAVLINCTPASQTLPYVRALSSALRDTPLQWGAYANAGRPEEGMGWGCAGAKGADRYAALAATWVEEGATLVGSCCGTGPETIAALRKRLF